MAVPKSRTSRSRTRSRRAQWRADSADRPADLVAVRVDGERRRVPRRLVRAAQRGYLAPGRGAR